MSLDIWELAKRKVAEREQQRASREEDGLALNDESSNDRKDERTLVICGGKSSGKTSMIHRFLDKNETIRPTTPLEYLYARRLRGNSKQLCHIWELGGGIRFSNLLAIPITKDTVTSASVAIVIDLTKPNEIKSTVEGLLPFARKEAEKALKQLNATNPDAHDAFKEEMKKRLEGNREQQLCAPFPIPLSFIGNKYDEFQNRETDERRKVCKLMRFLAHYYGATLVFYSSRQETTLAKGRLLFAHHAFGAQTGRASQTDLSKPLFVPVAADSFADIGPPPTNESSYSSLRASQPIDLWWGVFNESFPTTESKSDKVLDPSLDPRIAEPAIDAFIEQKKRDLEIYARQKKERQAAEERANEKIKGQY